MGILLGFLHKPIFRDRPLAVWLTVVPGFEIPVSYCRQMMDAHSLRLHCTKEAGSVPEV